MISVSGGIRFLIVGVLGTLTYIVTTLLAAELLAIPVAFASLLGFTLSLLVSYAGHALFTFRVNNRHHARYATRFLITSIGLAVLCSALAQLLVSKGNMSTTYTTGVVSALYPAASFLLHSLWSFAAPLRSESLSHLDDALPNRTKR